MSWSGRLIAALLVAALCFSATGVPVARAAEFAWPSSPTSSRQAGEQACAEVLFVGVRGSVEPAPYGTTVASWRDALAEQTRARLIDPPSSPGRLDQLSTVREVDVDYPATEPQTILSAGLDRLLFDRTLPPTEFGASVTAGVAELTRVLTDSRTRCPRERWVIVGFSQGAQVINQTLAGDLVIDQLLAAVLLGNPGHYQGQPVTEYGSADESAQGLMASLAYIRRSSAAGRDAGGQARAEADGVRAVLELGQQAVQRPLMSQAAEVGQLAVQPEARNKVISVCAAGDLVCDAGPGLYRIVLQGDPSREIAAATGPHTSYGGPEHPAAVRAVAERMQLLIPGAPLTPSVAAGSAVVGIVVAASVVAGLAVLAVLVIARRRRHSSE